MKKKKAKLKKQKTFKRGTVVVFDSEKAKSMNLSEEELIKYYGCLGYGSEKPKFFVYMAPILNAPGHCVLISLDNQQVETMRHDCDFREVRDDEF